jgi:hypothetical protein
LGKKRRECPKNGLGAANLMEFPGLKVIEWMERVIRGIERVIWGYSSREPVARAEALRAVGGDY